MPEGDTIHKVAAAMAAKLNGVRLERVTVRGRAIGTLAGARVESVSAKGKHLFIATDCARTLRSHLGMHGSWHRYRIDEPWQRPMRQAGLTLHTEHEVFVCFNPKDVELLRSRGVRARIAQDRLGPDLSVDGVTLDGVARRARAYMCATAAIVDVLLDQRIASGIGNVYKSELLFIEWVAPQARLSEIADSQLDALYQRAHTLLRANLGGGRRVTRFERDGAGRLWVYRRAGAPCLRCDTPIVSAHLGESWRSTYWCPRCQRASASNVA